MKGVGPSDFVLHFVVLCLLYLTSPIMGRPAHMMVARLNCRA